MLAKINANILKNTYKKGNVASPAKKDELCLMTNKLKFSPEQLRNLNYIFHNRFNEEKIAEPNEVNILEARTIAERLIQRLVCGVGKVDNKFSSKYLVYLHNPDDANTKLEYLVRLDNLSTPTLYPNDLPPELYIIENYPDFPSGYARIRIFSSLYHVWGEFADDQGYLRRDRIQTRYVELLSQVAESECPNSPMNIDESVLCASPGKVVDACTLHNILKTPPEEHVYFGANGAGPRFPDPRDFRLAIVDEPDGILLKVEFLAPDLYSVCMDIRLLIGIETEFWPSSSSMPSRILFGHCDSLLYQQAAQMGFYLVGYGVQSSAWHMRFPASEDVILKNNSPTSTIRKILNVCTQILDDIFNESELHQKFTNCYRLLNNYILKSVLFYELEKDSANPITVLLNWSPPELSRHVLVILDTLIISLRRQHYPNYFIHDANLLKNPGHLSIDDYIYEANRVTQQLVKFSEISRVSHEGDGEFDKMNLGMDLEMMLLNRWIGLVQGLTPSTKKGKRANFSVKNLRWEEGYTQFTSRQLEYLSLLLKNGLNVIKSTLKPLVLTCGELVPSKSQTESNLTQDIVSILLAIIEQAKDHYLAKRPGYKARQKLAEEYDTFILKLIDAIYKSGETINDHLDFVKIILKWLYRAVDLNKRLFSPMLKPYLSMLFVSSHENSWFWESIRRRVDNDELVTLGAFCSMVNEDKISPGDGLMEYINTNCRWAMDVLKIVEQEEVRVVFVSGRGKISRHNMSVLQFALAQNHEEGFEYLSMPKNSYFYKLFNSADQVCEYKTPRHVILRDNSPMTKVFDSNHRYGEHRCYGDIVKTIIAMQKMNVFNDICAILPRHDGVKLLELIHKNSNVMKLAHSRSGNNLLNVRMPTVTSQYCMENYQKYAPKEESGAKFKEQNFYNRNAELNYYCKSDGSESSHRALSRNRSSIF